MESADKFFAHFFSGENLAYTATSAKVWTRASIVFLSKNTDILKMILIFLSVSLLIGIIYSAKRGIRETQKMRSLRLNDVLGLGPAFRPRSLKAWQVILKRLESGEEGDLKLAVIEADHLFDHLLVLLSYGGLLPDERFKKLSPSQFSDVKGIHESHETAHKLLTEPGLQITHAGAEKIISVYKKAFEEIGLIDPES